AAARAEVRSLEAQRDVAERNLKRRAKLVETRAVSREEYDEALFDFRAGAARVKFSVSAMVTKARRRSTFRFRSGKTRLPCVARG
ncbi:MAG: hypothetical protein AAFX81_21725, partial [Pseudomonadota bacterium]